VRRHNIVGVRALTLASALIFGLVGVVRGCAQSIISHSSATWTFWTIVVTTGVALIWVPITLLSAVVWDRGARRRRLVAELAVILTGAVFAEPALYALFVSGVPSLHVPYFSRVIFRLGNNLVYYAAVQAACWATAYQARDALSRLRLARAEEAVADAELQVLTMQLHPHFLFNTLNLISQLVYEDVGAGLKTLANLRQLLQESLRYGARRAVSVREELQITTAYLEIQQQRFRERLHVVISATDAAFDAAIPPLLLQPLVENAIRHGIGVRAGGGTIEISALRDGAQVVLHVSDNGPGLSRRHPPEGLGLSNTRLRLERYFGGNASLIVSDRADGGTVASLVLPYRAHADDACSDTSAPPESPPSGPRVHEGRGPTKSGRVSLFRLPRRLQLVGAWFVASVIWTQITAAEMAADGAQPQWGSLLRTYLLYSASWLGLTWIPRFMAARMAVDGARGFRQYAQQALVGLLVAGVHMTLWIGLLRLVSPSDYLSIRRGLFAWTLSDTVVYSILFSICLAAIFRARSQEAELGGAASRARLRMARIASLRLHLQPEILFGGLDAIAAMAESDAAACEVTISKVADMLRLLIIHADKNCLKLKHELEVLRSYIDVRNPDAPIDVSFAQPELTDASIFALVPTLLAAATGADLLSMSIRAEREELHVDLMIAAEAECAHARHFALESRFGTLFGSRFRHTMTTSHRGVHLHVAVPYEADDVGADGQLPHLAFEAGVAV
jgi:signal transduction histidine kinase